MNILISPGMCQLSPAFNPVIALFGTRGVQLWWEGEVSDSSPTQTVQVGPQLLLPLKSNQKAHNSSPKVTPAR